MYLGELSQDRIVVGANASRVQRGGEHEAEPAGIGHSVLDESAREGGELIVPDRAVALVAGQVDVRVPAARNGERVAGDDAPVARRGVSYVCILQLRPVRPQAAIALAVGRRS